MKLVSDTRVVRLGRGMIAQAAAVFASCFGSKPAVIVADPNTFAAAGRNVFDVLCRASIPTKPPLILDQPDLFAHFHHVEQLEQHFAGGDSIPVAVGSGTINDLTKLAAHRSGRPYMVVATAASMDGYTAYGASVTHQGSKQTFFCPAPAAVIADLDVICRAPSELNAAGYADLMAKIPAGADWLLAGALGVEAIEPQAWAMVQEPLRTWLGQPAAIRVGNFDAIAGLMEGLLMTGFAMQQSRSSRPASGAEHQFSHLWDMQGHRHNGRVPYHGHKVGIGTLASVRLYEELMALPIEKLDVEQALAAWLDVEVLQADVCRRHEVAELRAVALQESTAKHVSQQELARRLQRLKSVWTNLRGRLHAQLIPADELKQMLGEAGAPDDAVQIGIDLPRLRESYLQARQIRRRYTVLDLAADTGLMHDCLDHLFPSIA